MSGPIVISSVGDGSRTTFADGIEVVAAVARGVAGASGERVHWLVPGALAGAARQQAGEMGVDQVDIMGADWAPAGPDAAVDALVSYAASRGPGVIFFAQTFEGRLSAARLAGRLNAPVVTNALAVAAAGDGLEVTASAFGGDVRAVYAVSGASLSVITVLPAATGATVVPGRAVTFEELPAPAAADAERIEIVEPAQASGPRLEEAKIVVSGGRGLGKPENYALVQALADALGGLAAASRPIVDEGWVDSSRQVGLTGRITRPDLYVAAGISGASQHMAGCSASRVIVAINSDRQAPIFRYARLGIVGDCLEVLPAVTKALQG